LNRATYSCLVVSVARFTADTLWSIKTGHYIIGDNIGAEALAPPLFECGGTEGHRAGATKNAQR